MSGIDLIGLNQTFSAKLAFPYFQFLIAKQEVAAAQIAWQQLANVDTSLQPYLPSHYNLIVNGGFEENLLNGGFDWWYKIEPSCCPGHWIRVSFTAERDLFPSPSMGIVSRKFSLTQFIPVKPNTDYEFSAAMQDRRHRDCQRSPLRNCGRLHELLLRPYRRYAGHYSLASATSTISNRAEHKSLIVEDRPRSCAPLIRGKLWIDDVKLVETNN